MRKSKHCVEYAVRRSICTAREYAFHILRLKSFTEEEIEASFNFLRKTTAGGDKILLGNAIRQAAYDYQHNLSPETVRDIVQLFPSNKQSSSELINLREYKKIVETLGEKLDPRVYNIGACFLMTGASVGIIIPCMPLLVAQLGIPASEFGLVISAFGLSKLMGNIPSGYLVERYGRKPLMIAGLGVCGVGLGALGLATLPGFGTPWLIACRFVSGLGVSAFIAGGSMYMSGDTLLWFCFDGGLCVIVFIATYISVSAFFSSLQILAPHSTALAL